MASYFEGVGETHADEMMLELEQVALLDLKGLTTMSKNHDAQELHDVRFILTTVIELRNYPHYRKRFNSDLQGERHTLKDGP